MTKDSAIRRILLVDDSPDITLTIKTGLEQSSLFQVDTFNDPELALSSFKPEMYDLTLLDLRMPKMYGHELYDKMKRLDPKLKICFMTATYQNYEALKAAGVIFKNQLRSKRPGKKDKCRVTIRILTLLFLPLRKMHFLLQLR